MKCEGSGEENMINTHSHIHHVSSSLGAGQHGGYPGSSRVVCVHMDGYIGETISQGTNQKLAGLWLQQAGHVLIIQTDKRGRVLNKFIIQKHYMYIFSPENPGRGHYLVKLTQEFTLTHMP